MDTASSYAATSFNGIKKKKSVLNDKETDNSQVSPYKVKSDVKSRSPFEDKVLLNGDLFSMIALCLCALWHSRIRRCSLWLLPRAPGESSLSIATDPRGLYHSCETTNRSTRTQARTHAVSIIPI